VAVVLGVGGVADQAMAQAVCGTTIGVPADGAATALTGYITWGDAVNPGPICLEEPIFIGNPTLGGGTAGSPPNTLRSCAADTTGAPPGDECRGHITILPGTIIRGQPRRAATGTINNNPGALLVTRDSMIIADGTPTTPIIMTTAAVDNDNDGVCDNLNGDAFTDPHPGFVPNLPAGCTLGVNCCADLGNCTVAATPATAQWCDDDPLNAPLAPLNADGRENVRLWGGVVIAGNAPANLGDDEGQGWGEGILEGIQVPQTDIRFAQYCGAEPHDNSGIFRYVSVRHAGDELAPANELNGVSLGCVGDGTIYEFVEVYTNQDDGHEWFGGTVNGNHLITMFAGDDQFDLDEGYSGALQFLFTIMPHFNETNGATFGVSSGDRMGEWDLINANNVTCRTDEDEIIEGPGAPPCTPWPYGAPYIWNMTGIGSTPDGANPAVSDAAANIGLFMTAQFAGQVYNSIFVNTGASAGLSCDAAGGQDGRSCDTNDNDLVDLTRVVSSCFFDTGAVDAEVIERGDEWSDFVTDDPALLNVTGGVTDVLVQESPVNFTGGGGADGKLPFAGLVPYDPRPVIGGDCDLEGLQPQDTGLDRSATYRGAFEPGATELWTTGWSAAWASGLLP
jgi:hypothetical protein